MLSHLTIRSLAVIDHLELDCEGGMTSLTGETGAGKSILVDALGLLLGARADADMIRAGADRAEVCGVFETSSNGAAREWLAEHQLEDGSGECFVRRVLGPGGRSRAFVNQRPMPAHLLRDLGERLVDIQGQHMHHQLLRRERQRTVVDDFGGHHEVLEKVADAAGRWRALHAELTQIAADGADDASRLDFLRFQLRELESLGLEPDEPEGLAAEHRRLANAESIVDGYRGALDRLDGDHDHSVSSILTAARRDLDAAERHDPQAGEVVELIETAAINVAEASAALRTVAESPDLDPERLARVERRLADIHDLARKHRVSANDLPGHAERLRERVTGLESSEERAGAIERELANAENTYRSRCAELTTARGKAARSLAGQVTAGMRELGMPGGSLTVDVRGLDTAVPSPNGADQVEFVVSTGPGQPPRPLSKVASGGELSRISLAIQVSSARGAAVPTLVFDEADVGIGGRVAEIVGRQLRTLGASCQILCVTHLAQVACRGHRQVVIRKSVGADGTPSVDVVPVRGDERIAEIARMLGGEKITSKTIAHAREMLDGS